MTTAHTTTPLPFLVPAANLIVGDVLPDSADGTVKGGTVAERDVLDGGVIQVVFADRSRAAFTPDCPVEVTNRFLARDLRKGDTIRMGVIDTVTPHETYVGIRFESKYGEHGTAFPPDLLVTVLSRAEAEVDVVAELTALADTWEHRATLLRQEIAECDAWVKLERMPHALEAETCAHQLRELIGRLA